MRKLSLGLLTLICFSSCQYVDNSISTLKNNVKESLEISNMIPSIDLKRDNKNSEVNATDSVSHFTLTSFFVTKFVL